MLSTGEKNHFFKIKKTHNYYLCVLRDFFYGCDINRWIHSFTQYPLTD